MSDLLEQLHVTADHVPARASLCGRLAAFFKDRAGQWIDGRELATVAGLYAWRSRVSDLRRAPYGLVIENRQRRNGRFCISEYRLRPSDPEGAAA